MEIMEIFIIIIKDKIITQDIMTFHQDQWIIDKFQMDGTIWEWISRIILKIMISIHQEEVNLEIIWCQNLISEIIKEIIIKMVIISLIFLQESITDINF